MIEYKGFQVGQAENYHLWIVKDGKTVLHAQCDKPLSDDELKAKVDAYIEFTYGGGFKVVKS